MNAHTIHDALTLLPDDLIAETDAVRRAPKRRVWKTLLPIAACLCLVLLTAPTVIALLSPKGAKEAAAYDCVPAEAAPEAPAAAPSPMQASPQPGNGQRGIEEQAAGEAFDAGGPLAALYFSVPAETEGEKIALISTRAELDACLDPDSPLAQACGAYDDAYFETHQLVLLLTAVDYPAGSRSGDVLLPIAEGSWYAEQTGENAWTLTLRDMVPDAGTQGLSRQQILLELPGCPVASGDELTVIQQAKTE